MFDCIFKEIIGVYHAFGGKFHIHCSLFSVMASSEDAGFVPDLTKQHCGRPKYARVISWELSRDAEADPAEKRKERRSCERKMRKEKRIVEHKREEKPKEELVSSSSDNEAESEELAANSGEENVIDIKEVPKMSKKLKTDSVKKPLSWV